MNERLIKKADCEGMWLFIHNHFLRKKKIEQTGTGGEGDKMNTIPPCSVLLLSALNEATP